MNENQQKIVGKIIDLVADASSHKDFEILFNSAYDIVRSEYEFKPIEFFDFMKFAINFARDQKNGLLLFVLNRINDIFFRYLTKLHLDTCMEIARQLWSPHSADAIGTFQSLKDPRYVDPLYEVALASLPNWEERCDENQQFFRKCAWALGEISTREFTEHRAIDTLLKMAEVEPPVAAYWAKKQLNRRLGEKSPYANDDLDDLPEVDYDWPYADKTKQG